MAPNQCQVDGCERLALARGWCGMHYQRWKANGDPLVDRRATGRRTCTINGCTKQVVGRGWCANHYERWRRHGDPLGEAARGNPTCTVDGCGGEHVARGYCGKHYQRLISRGTIELQPRKSSGPCKVGDCEGKVVGFGFCTSHYRRYRKFGDPAGRMACAECSQHPRKIGTNICESCIEATFERAGYRLTGTFVSPRIGVPAIHVQCGEVVSPRLDTIRQGRGCAACARRLVGDLNRLSVEAARESLAQIGLVMTGEYVDANAHTVARCTRCNSDVRVRVGMVRNALADGKRTFGCRRCMYASVAAERRTPEDVARAEFGAAGVELIGGFIDTKTPIQGKCLRCSRKITPTLGSIRRGQGGCRYCVSIFYCREKIEGAPELANADAYIYIVEFDDCDGTVFRKFGIGRHGTAVDRLKSHVRMGARLVDVGDDTLLTCFVAEQAIKRSVGEWAYTPATDKLRGGITECYLPGPDIDLGAWLNWARSDLRATVPSHD